MIRNLLVLIRRGLMGPRPDVPSLPAVGAEEICPSFVGGRIQLERVAECEAGVSIRELTLLAHLARSRSDARNIWGQSKNSGEGVGLGFGPRLR